MTHRISNGIVGLVVLAAFSMTGILACADEEALSDERKKDIIQQIYRAYKKNFPEVTNISVEKAMALSQKQQVVFIDIRTPDEQAVSTIAGAITEKMVTRDPTIIDGKTAIVYCTIGYRSGIFAEKMAILGIPVSNMAGGLMAWLHAGGKVFKGESESKQVHIFAKKWNYAPQRYETVAFGFWERLTNW